MPHNETVQKFLDALGPFYEYVNEDNKENEIIVNEKLVDNGLIQNNEVSGENLNNLTEIFEFFLDYFYRR